MATTTNYGFEIPEDTDLVKDGALAMRTLGQDIDTTTKALNPSTTLGDIEYRSATADTNTRLGIGSTGDVLTVAGGVPSWAAPAGGGSGLVFLTGATLTAAASWNLPNDTFTSTYRNYMIMIEGRDGTSNDAVLVYPRASGTNNSGGLVDFAFDGWMAQANSAINQRNTNQNYFLPYYANEKGGSATIYVYAPKVATQTQATWLSNGSNSGNNNTTASISGAAYVDNTTSYDALGFIMSGNSFTGTYRVYGLADA
jgi:hypothetical protein